MIINKGDLVNLIHTVDGKEIQITYLVIQGTSKREMILRKVMSKDDGFPSDLKLRYQANAVNEVI